MRTFKEEFAEIQVRCESEEYLSSIVLLKQVLGQRPLVLFGAGTLGSSLARSLLRWGIRTTCFCDSVKSGVHEETGIPIVSPSLLETELSDANVIICSVNFFNEIKVNLQALGIAPERIFSKDTLPIHEMTIDDLCLHLDGYEWTYNLLKDDRSKQIVLERIKGYLFSSAMIGSLPFDQYFDPDIIQLTDDEVFVDGGMFTGDTAENFINRVDGKMRHYYGFEPDESNYLRARENLDGHQNITLLQAGLWSREDALSFSDSLSSSSALSASGTNLVHVTALDLIFANNKDKPTFIKMDVEGAEKEALIGAENLIRTWKPKLAICVYHKPEDLYELPKLLQEWNSNYSFALRHYSNSLYESVLYAVDING